jgi:Cytochrome c552
MKTGIWLVSALIILPLVLAWALFRSAPLSKPESSVADRPVQLADRGYTSSQACQACHPGEYGAWHASYHRTMTQLATPETVAVETNDDRVTATDGRPILVTRQGAEIWAEFDEPDWDGKGSAPPRIRRRVVMTTGSHNQQIFWYATGHDRVLGQLPAIRLVAEQRWLPRRSATMHPPGLSLYSESGSWNGICVQCHTTQGRPEFSTPYGSQSLSSQHVETSAVEFGIACESCHGPGEAHVRANSSPLRRYLLHLKGARDPSIVQPMKLDPKRSSQVCGQCHSLWEFYDSAGEREANSNGLPYRPGDDLAATRFIAQPTRNMDSPTMTALLADDPTFISSVFWSDGMVRATGREYNGLIDSPCYKNAHDAASTMSCFSCHSMHKEPGDARSLDEWASGQIAVGREGNGACLQCHRSLAADVAAHTKHRADSTGSSCYNCHMPFTTYGLLKTIRSHQISSPSVQATLQTGRPNACNLCHLDKTLAWTGEQLDRWYGQKGVRPLFTFDVKRGLTPFSEDDRTIAASLLTLLKGDAGQRAIAAQAMSWRAAQDTSGTSWMAPYLALLLNDPYDAVRFIAGRSLRSLPGFGDFEYDPAASSDARLAMRRRALERWRDLRSSQVKRTDAALLFTRDSLFEEATINRLIQQRDNRRVFYRE